MHAELRNRPDFLRNMARHPWASALSALGTGALFGGFSNAVNGPVVGIVLGVIGLVIGASFGAMTAESASRR